MRIYDITDDEGRVSAFEVSNVFLPRSTACHIAQGIPGVKLIRGPRIFPSQDDFCEFEFKGVTFVLWEPWGDNSRYWIGPKAEGWVPQIPEFATSLPDGSPLVFAIICSLAYDALSEAPMLTASDDLQIRARRQSGIDESAH